jgi:hypothetical protein
VRAFRKRSKREGIALSSALSLEQLKADLRLKHGVRSVAPETLRGTKAVSTGWSELDAFVDGGGFPCGKISLLEASEGHGALTLWLDTAAQLTRAGQRVAWLNSGLDDREPFQLHPPTALQRSVDLQKLFLVDPPEQKKRSWILQELLASQLFSLVGCDLGEAHLPLREGRSLLMQARRSGAAVVLFSRRRESREPPAIQSLASLVLKFEARNIEVIRAAHRPVPFCLTTHQRRDRHVDFITGSDSLDPSFVLASSGANPVLTEGLGAHSRPHD